MLLWDMTDIHFLTGGKAILMANIEKFCEVINSRKSIRAYLDKNVEIETVKNILQLSARAPSGANLQPWQVTVISGNALKSLGKTLFNMALSGKKEKCEYQFYPKAWREPYLSRRRKVGWDLYRSLGIARAERSKINIQQAKNFIFFGAPIGLIFTMDRDMEMGSWLDLGAFIQTVALVARSYGLDTCIQAAFSEFHEKISQEIDLPPNRQIICGMALGYRDENAPENQFPTERMSLDDFVRFID